MLRAAQSARTGAGRRQLRDRRARRTHSAPGHQGRLALVRAELLPPLPAGCAPRRGDRHFDEPHRFPLHPATVGWRV